MAGTAREVLRLRLESQWIARVPSSAAAARPGAAGITAVAAHLLATQAQDFAQGVWALGVRSPGATRDDVTAALDSAQVVRSWPMRGTLHFCTPDDLRWMLALTAERTVRSAAARHRDLHLDDDTFARAADIAAGELRGGGALSREEFLAALTAGGVDPAGQRGMHIIWRLAHDGLLCWGPTSGTQQALVLLDEWAPARREPSRDEALGEFVLRYFGGHGPATLDDFCWWSKSTVADAKRGFERVRDRLDELVIDGTSYWMRADDGWTEETADATGTAGIASEAGTTSEVGSTGTHRGRGAGASPIRGGVHALPGFDEYLLGYRERSHALPAEHADRIVPGGNGIFLPMLVSKGRIVGTWRRSVSTKAVTLTPEFFEAPTAAELRGVERAFARYGQFLGLPVKATPTTATGEAP
ncbi:winged helix DNA-binding domain-containing protein [Herbiconiux sp. 11R-BC]|uniref:winged helix DNA-binding domain-containing protein n=1 Tax=Herbiconiux sp. 11R-BC TaxID=3111637 RepID=UPI003BFEF910